MKASIKKPSRTTWPGSAGEGGRIEIVTLAYWAKSVCWKSARERGVGVRGGGCGPSAGRGGM